LTICQALVAEESQQVLDNVHPLKEEELRSFFRDPYFNNTSCGIKGQTLQSESKKRNKVERVVRLP
jgi:hypothetical protein